MGKHRLGTARPRAARRRPAPGALALAALALAASGRAGEDVAPGGRAERIAAEQAAKAARAETWREGRLERLVNRLEQSLVTGRIGWHPWLESAHPGGGLIFGGGWGRHVSPYDYVDLRGSVTIKGYTRLEGEFRAPRLFDRRADLSLVARFSDATQIGFYGLGTAATAKEDRANYGLRQGSLAAAIDFRPLRRLLVVGGGLEYARFEQRPGQGSWPSIEEIYDPDTAPGLGSEPSYLHARARVGLDWRPAPGYARRGGSYGATAHLYHDPDGQQSFRQLDCEAIQHWPVLRDTWVLSARARLQTTDTIGDQVIPFFMLPWLGGGSSLRGFRSTRFRDRHTLLLQAEWRIPLNHFLDLAVFYDAGEAVARWADLDLDGLKSDWGLGFRLHGPLATPLRIEVAHSNEQTKLVFSSHASF